MASSPPRAAATTPLLAGLMASVLLTLAGLTESSDQSPGPMTAAVRWMALLASLGAMAASVRLPAGGMPPEPNFVLADGRPRGFVAGEPTGKSVPSTYLFDPENSDTPRWGLAPEPRP